jgi:hypothetical protein
MINMKNIFYFLLAVVSLVGCSKNDGPVPEDVGIIRVPGVTVTINPASDKFISPISPAAFKGKFDVDLVFADEKPQSVDIVVMRNKNPADVKIIQAGVSSFPTTIDVTGQQLITLFGQPITGGASFTFGADIKVANGQTIPAFPLTGTGATAYASGAINAIAAVKPGTTTEITFLMPCPYDPEIYKGDFEVVKDTWADTNPGDIITLTKIDATHFSFIYPTAVNPEPIIVAVDPATNTPSIALQTVGTAWVYDDDPPPPTVKTTPGAANLVDPCIKQVSLNVTWTEGTGSYPRVFVLKKK